MNKFTKGAIATGAGIVLLLGGAGTFAYWNDSADIAAGDIESGTLSLVAGVDGWEDQDGDTIADINDFLIVPGDELTFTGDYTIDATGDNLLATLDVDDTDFLADLPADLVGELSVSFSVDAVAGPAEITSANDGDTVVVVVTVTFPFGATVDNTTQAETVDLSSLDITLTQHL
jgi:alternate signal-mediated exported protein